MKIFFQLFLILILSNSICAQSNFSVDSETPNKVVITESEYLSKLDHFQNLVLNFERIVFDAEKDIARSEIEVSDFHVEKENFIDKIISWFSSKKKEDPLKSLSSEEQVKYRTLLGDISEKAKTAKSIMITLSKKVKELGKELKNARDLKHDLKNKYEHLTKEESQNVSTEFKKIIGHLSRTFERMEKEVKDLKNRSDALLEQSRKIKEKLTSVS